MTDGAQDRSMSIGDVFSRAFGVMGNNPITVFGVVLLFVAVPQIFTSLFVESLKNQNGTELAVLGVVILNLLVSIVLTSLAQGALVRATVAYSEGGRAGFGESVGAGLRKALPLFAVSLLLGLGMMLGMLFLVVPGIILAVMWSVAVPALVSEDLGVFEAFGRSGELTRGSRWKIFGLFLIVIVILFAVAMLYGVIAVMGGLIGPSVVGIAASAIFTTILTAFYVTIQTALYVELREEKEGPAGEQLAEVFA